MAVRDSRRPAFLGGTPGMDCQHFRNSHIADNVDHTRHRPQYQQPGSRCGRMVWIPSASSDGTYASISIYHDMRREIPMDTPSTHLWQACKAPAVLCSARGIASVALRRRYGYCRDELACKKGMIRSDTANNQIQKAIAHLMGCAVGQIQCLRGVRPISRCSILIGRCRIYLNCNVCIHVYSIDYLIGWSREYYDKAGIYSFDT
jgi:hypothetical protein